MKFLCDNCKAKYQIADEKVAGKAVRMKCRKCGHQIEVRAAITETSVSMAPPKGDSAPPRPAARLSGAPGRANAKPATPSSFPDASTSGALAGAFQRTVQQDAVAISVQETPAAHELSVTDEWYVAINGVPVGPVRMSELRRKAASGSVTEDSLAWQEGLEEWRPVRSLPDLAAIVREAAQGNRPSLISPPHAEAPKPSPAPPKARPIAPSRPPPSPRRDSVPMTERLDAGRPQAPATGRSNVVPFHGRAAASAAALDEQHGPMTAPLAAAARAPAPGMSIAPRPPTPSQAPRPPTPSQAPRPPTPAPFAATALSPLAPIDPFAVPRPAPLPAADPFAPVDPFAVRAPLAAPSSVASGAPIVPASMSLAPPVALGSTSKKGVPLWFWPVMVFVLGFGGVAAWFIFKDPPPERVVIQQVPTPAAPTQAALPPLTTETAEPAPTPSAGTPKPATGGARVAQAPASTGGGTGGTKTADLSGLLGGAGGPSVGPGSAGASSAGGGLDSATVQRIVRERSPAVKRACWERGGGDQKSSAKVTVAITVGPSGRVESAQANGDDPVIAKCIENQVRGWTFPAPGSQTTINVPFVFVRQ